VAKSRALAVRVTTSFLSSGLLPPRECHLERVQDPQCPASASHLGQPCSRGVGNEGGGGREREREKKVRGSPRRIRKWVLSFFGPCRLERGDCEAGKAAEKSEENGIPWWSQKWVLSRYYNGSMRRRIHVIATDHSMLSR
jgi:hypothetical protein